MSEDAEGRVWVGLGCLGHIFCHMSGRGGVVGCVADMCVSVWLLHLAISAPCREGKTPMGIEETKACLATAQ